jgi:hypothetical protein
LRRILILAALSLVGISFSQPTFGSGFTVYSIYQSLNLGNPGEITQKDFYVNIGSNQGIATGTRLQVFRHTPTFDLVSQQVYREVTFPIAFIKVIHVEPSLSIARLENFLPPDQAAVSSPKAVMVGDLVEIVPLSK